MIRPKAAAALEMRTYELYGIALESDLAFPELAGSTAWPVITIRAADEFPPTANGDHEIVHAQGWSARATDDGYLVRFDGYATFALAARGDRVDCWPESSTTADSLRHLLLAHVLPLVLNLRGFTVVHASAVADGTGACAFLAESGVGKSTMAGSFAAHGWTPLADDGVLLEEDEDRIYGRFSYPGLRLWPDSVAAVTTEGDRAASDARDGGKRRIIRGPAPAAPRMPLDCLYLLAPSPNGDDVAIRIEPITPRDATLALIRSAFRLDITDQRMLVTQFRFLAGVAARVPVRRLIYPRMFSLLPRVREAVIEDLRVLRSGRCPA